MIFEIRNDSDYANVLARIEALMDAEPGSPECQELDALIDLIVDYELRDIV